MRIRKRHRLRRVLAWAFVLVAASLAGGVWFAYLYVTDSETLTRVIRSGASTFLPGATVDVGRAKVRVLAGELHLTHVAVRQVIDGVSFETLHIPWLNFRHDPRALYDGKFEPTDVVVAQPTLRVRRRADGTWNLQGLLASPWPATGVKTPPVVIENGTVEFSSPDDPPGAKAAAVLREVKLRVVAAGPGKLSFDGSAKGDTFDRLAVQGLVDVKTGRVELSGDVARLVVTETLRGRLPAEFRPAASSVGLTAGEADVRINSLIYDPAAAVKVRYDVAGRLVGGVLNCKKFLPFPINDLTAGFALKDGEFTLDRAEGSFGGTTVHLDRGRFRLGDPERMPFDLELEIADLELDQRLRDWTPPQFAGLWKLFRPAGRLSVAVSAGRDAEGGPVRRKAVVECHDVSMLYEHFKYPVEHVRGRVVWDGDRVELVGLHTVVGGRPLSANGTIDHPGDRSVVSLTFEGEALPIDKALFDALPPDVRAVVAQFSPTGTVRGKVKVGRTPPAGPGADPRGVVKIDAYLDLNERCGMKWVGLPYPVNDLTGRLEIHPDLWEFKNMRGVNGQAVITGSGRVQKVSGPTPAGRLNVDLHLNAEMLPFNDQLKAALPLAWRRSWGILDPTGSSDVDATIRVHPGEPDRYVLVVAPRPATDVRLHYTRPPKPGVDPGGTFELRLEDVTGRFVFDNGPVEMKDVGFRFHDAPVQFARGRVAVEESGRFALGVGDLWVKDIRLDSRLRQIMPPVTDQFARKLDDGKTFTLKGNLGLAWSGKPGEPVRCDWNSVLVVFNDNSVEVQPGLSLEHVQGQLDHVRGRTDGDAFELHGALRLESVGLLGQQVTRLESPIHIENNKAVLDSLSGDVLGGRLTGALAVTLDATPRYAASLAVAGADLQQYAKTLSGRQKFRGAVNARLDLEGFGSDLHTLQGGGKAEIVDGDLGELPVYLKLFKLVNRAAPTKTAFDSAEVSLNVHNGKTYFEPIRLTGNAFSLLGRGTMDVQGDLDLRLRVLFGRDKLHLRGVSDLAREASGQFFVVRVSGTPSYPKFELVPLPGPTDILKSFGRRRDAKDETQAR